MPESEANKLIKLAWIAKPLNGSDSAMFKVTVSGNGRDYVAYVPSGNTATAYPIANLPEGKYSFSITPHSNVSGTYVYVLQFYSFG